MTPPSARIRDQLGPATPRSGHASRAREGAPTRTGAPARGGAAAREGAARFSTSRNEGARLGPLVGYGALSLVAIAAAFARGQSPIGVAASEAWLPLPDALGGIAGHAISIVAGGGLAFATIRASRQFVRRWAWARALHSDLRPSVKHARNGTIVLLGITSAVGEELFFRGLLATTIGLIASSLAFGLLHQMRGRVRWVWAGWATVMGLLFGALFLATGSLLGALLAHAAINVANLRFLRDTDVDAPKERHLGGLLGRA